MVYDNATHEKTRLKTGGTEVIMEYRQLPHGTEREKFGVLGLGLGGIGKTPADEIEAIIRKALDHGINYFDLCTAGATYAPFGRAIAGKRDRVFIQVHFGAVYDENGEYGWCRDFDKLVEIGVLDYLKALKAQGTVRHIGFSSHTPSVANRILDTGLVDMMMFSINPAYDFEKGDEWGIGSVKERFDLFKRCKKEGVGISVMKPFFAGQLLSAEHSPFGQALSRTQCLQYALDRPGVLVALPGVQTMEHLDQVLEFLNATPEEKDYSVIGGFTADTVTGTCVYCNHCQPCPAGIDIGLANKYYDLALAGDAIAANHYTKLTVKASACLQCGHCESRCPFSVKQMERMEKISAYFGE